MTAGTEGLDAAVQEWRGETLKALRDASNEGDALVVRELGRALNALRGVSDWDTLEGITDRVQRLHDCLWSQVARRVDDRSLL